MQGRLVSNLLGVVSGVVGGVAGYFVFLWLLRQGFYGLMIPGALVGLGCGLLARHPSVVRGTACALAACALGLFAEWKAFRFVADESFAYMVRHFLEKPGATLIMFAGGVLLAFWLGKDAGFGARGQTRKQVRPTGGVDESAPTGSS